MSDETQPQPLALPETAGSSQHGTMLALPAVAERLGCSVATVRRMLKRNELEGSQLQRGPSGEQWTVPLATVESVLAKRSKKAAQAPVTVRASAPAAALSEELVRLRQQVIELERRAAVAETEAYERGQRLEQQHEQLRLALSALNALTAAPATQAAEAAALRGLLEQQRTAPASKRRWWQRTNP